MYHRDMDAYESAETDLMELTENKDALEGDTRYWYFRMVASGELAAANFESVLLHLLEAEKAGDAHDLNKSAISIYLNIGHCLTDMGYASKAIEYLQKLIELAIQMNQYNWVTQAQSLLALNYINLGNPQEALRHLHECLSDERKETMTDTRLMTIYRRIALAYTKTGDNDLAIEYINKANKCSGANDYNKHNDAYHFYCESIIQFAVGNKEAGMKCLDDAIKEAEPGTLYDIMYNAYKHYFTLTEKKSLTYIKEVALPRFKQHGAYLHLLECYEKLVGYYQNILEENDKAQDYQRLADKLSGKLRKGELT